MPLAPTPRPDGGVTRPTQTFMGMPGACKVIMVIVLVRKSPVMMHLHHRHNVVTATFSLDVLRLICYTTGTLRLTKETP